MWQHEQIQIAKGITLGTVIDGVTKINIKPTAERIKQIEREVKARYRQDMEDFIKSGGTVQVGTPFERKRSTDISLPGRNITLHEALRLEEQDGTT